MLRLLQRATTRALVFLSILMPVSAMAQFGVPAPVTPAIPCPAFTGFPLTLNLGTISLFGNDGITNRCAFQTTQSALNTLSSQVSGNTSAIGLLAPLASPVFTGIPSMPAVTLTGSGSVGDASLFTALPTGGTDARTLADVTASGLYDAVPDILKARAAPGYNGDDAPVLNALFLKEIGIALHPPRGQQLLILNLKSTVKMPLHNQRLIGFGGMQAVQFNHDLSNTGDTLQIGDETDITKGAGATHVEGIWFTHPGRLGYTSGPLTGRLTAGQSHIKMVGGQHSVFRDLGGYGMPYFLNIIGSASTVIDSVFIYGGVWNINDPTAQEGIAQIRFASSPIFGHNTSGYISNFTMYGGNTLPSQTYTVGNNQYTSTRRIGPQYGILLESLEDGAINRGILAGYADSAIAMISRKPATGALNYITNIAISNANIDESNNNGIYMVRTTSDAGIISGIDIHDNTFNGQTIGLTGVNVDGTLGYPVVTKYKEHHNTYRSFISAPVKLSGVDGGQADHNRIAGYNLAGNDTTAGGSLTDTSGRVIYGNTRNFSTTSEVYGGGQNSDVEGNTNQWGYADITSGQNNTYSGISLIWPGLLSGLNALNLPGGALNYQGTQPRAASTAYTSTIGALSGTITTATVQGATYTIDQGSKWITAKVQVQISNNGTGAGALTFTLPFPAVAGPSNVGTGIVIGGKQVSVLLPSGTSTAQVFDYTGAYPAANGNTLALQIRYEAAL